MSNKTIKVIKREDRRRTGKSGRLKKNRVPEDPTRKAVQTVSGWVREFKEKGNAEANRVLATLFEKPPRPSEA